MQVGLATDRLGKNEIFQRASSGFTVFSILSPAILVGLVFCWFLALFMNNLFATLSFNNDKKKKLGHNHRSQSTV
jgi:lipopolysaccharide export LptBFGC system permease protein LptF